MEFSENNDEKEKIEKLEIHEKKENISGVYLFCSYDLANSTAYKKYSGWINLYYNFFIRCSDEMSKNFKNIKVWKIIGDEILFYLKITKENIKDLYNFPKKIYEILTCNLIDKFIDGDYEKKLYLSVKATLWSAYVIEFDPTNGGKYDNTTNIVFKERDLIFYKSKSSNSIVLDFWGPDIDTGFRIASKSSHRGSLAIDAKLAYLLSNNNLNDKTTEGINNAIDENSKNMRIVSYEELKGIWNERPYPIVWYQENWKENSFEYDDKHDIVRKIKEEIKGRKDTHLENNIKELEKVLNDVGKIRESKELLENV